MDKPILFFIVMFLFFAYGCKDSPTVVDNNETEIIKINIPSKGTKAEFDDYFSESVLVPLATTQESLIEEISRIIIRDQKIYILDRKTNSILLFRDDGSFIQRIQSIGKGPGEYLSLMDFAIDETNSDILLYTDRPYKFMVFSSNGEFIREERLSDSYNNMAYLAGKVLFLNKDQELGSLLNERDMKSKKERGYIPFEPLDVYYASVGSGLPYILKSKNIFVFFPYSNLIYEYTEDGIKVKYMIDFGDKNPPNTISDESMAPAEQYTTLLDDGYGMGISNFKETDDYIVFSYGWSTMALYNKDKKETYSFDFVDTTKDLGVFFNNFFAHDGDDNSLISISEASTFKRQMEIFRTDSKSWDALDDNIKALVDKVKEDDNPILLMYTLKKL